MTNTQKKLDKARPPRVQITYDVETGGAETQKELPLVIGVMGEFSQDDSPLRERRFTRIDKDNFNEIMQGMNPEIDILVDNKLNGKDDEQLAISLAFRSIDDFSPDNIASQITPLNKLLELREQLIDLRNRTASNERLKEQLAKILEEQNTQTGGDSENGTE